MDLIPIDSVVDVGCGLATWLKVFKSKGVSSLLGVESEETISSYLPSGEIEIIGRDLNSFFECNSKFDLAICLEVAEHLNPSAADDLVRTLTTLSDCILFSAAIPNQGGQNHINEQGPDYWKKKFQKHGYIMLDPFRKLLWKNEKVHYCYRQNCALLVRQDRYRDLDLPEFVNSYVHPDLLQRKVDSIEHIYAGRIGPRAAFKIFLQSLKWRLGWAK